MNNEIKEILEFKENADYKKLSCDEIKVLKDYITNLQTIEQQYSAILSENAELENKIINLQQKNEKLKELCDKYEEEHSNEFQCWKRDRKELLDKRTRIEKANEFINDDENLWVALGEDCGRPDDDLEELSNILNGRSDE